MKKIRTIVAILLCVASLLSMTGCKSDQEGQQETKAPVTGATVFQALKTQVDFDSTLTEVPDAENLFENLPDGSDVTLHKGPEEDSDQLGMVQVPNSSDLDAAEDSVNNYLQDAYDSVYASDPEAAKKFENVAIWKYDVYIVFCITVNYTEATQIINNTVGSGETADQIPSNNDENPPKNNGDNSGVSSKNYIDTWVSNYSETYAERIVVNDDTITLENFGIIEYFQEAMNNPGFEYFHGEGYFAHVPDSCYNQQLPTTYQYEKIVDGDYIKLKFSVLGFDFVFVLINEDMMGFYNNFPDRQPIDEIKPVIDHRNLYFRQNVEQEAKPMRELPLNGSIADELGPELAYWKCLYFPNTRAYLAWCDHDDDTIFFYTDKEGVLWSVRELMLINSDSVPQNAICTDYNYVITEGYKES